MLGAATQARGAVMVPPKCKQDHSETVARVSTIVLTGESANSCFRFEQNVIGLPHFTRCNPIMRLFGRNLSDTSKEKKKKLLFLDC